jgi:glycosyltransferase 2 family protein
VYEKRPVQFFVSQKSRTRYLRIFQWVIVIAIFVFLGKMVWDNWSQVKDAPFTLQPLPFILSTLTFVFSYFIQIWAWYLITLKLKISLSPSETLKTWLYSQLGKYLPGKIWLLLGRFYYYESRGKSKKSISVALYFEMVTIIVAAGLIFLAALIFHREIWLFYSWRQSGWLVLLFLLGFVSLHPRVLQKILNWILVQFKREPVSLSISYSDILLILFVCIVSWMIGGIGFYLFVDAVYPVAPRYILFLTGALAISSTLGLIAIFAPSGLGVREGALVYLLSLMMATPVAVIIAVLTRIWMTLIEIGLIGMVYLISRFYKGPEKGSQNV